MSQIYQVLDYETRSRADLKKVGAYEYANHPSTKLLCVSWKVGTFEQLKAGTGETRSWSPYLPSPYGEFKRCLLDPSIMLVAHNAFFEQVITRFVLPKYISAKELLNIPPSRWICTASMARALAFPGKLADACSALDLPFQKDMAGHKLMLKMSKPRRVTKNNPSEWHQKKSDLLRLIEYCKADTDAEAALFTTIPQLSKSEREVWLLDQKINWRGFRTDRKAVKRILKMIAIESTRFQKETLELTGGLIRKTSQRDATLKWLAANGLLLPNLQKKTVQDALDAGLATGKAETMLRLRQAASKTSTAKYEAFEMRSRTDGRVRDNLVYHTASTGRWGGAGVQPHNFPAHGLSVPDTDFAASLIHDPATDLGLLRMLYGEPMDAFSALLRSMIQASRGHEMFSGDFSGIELRVLFWIARHERGLASIREGLDLYCELASVIYNRTVLKDRDKAEREVGKRAVLGCGFGMGKDKFFETCRTFGQEVELELAATAVKAYRTLHAPVPRLWSNLDKAAIAAVQNRGTRYTINRTSWWVEGQFLYCSLPSGRRLTYYGPEIRHKETPWGEKKPTLYHWDVHPKTRKWVLNGTYGGKLTENVVQAIARDIMAAAMIRVERRGYKILITVHDEVLGERLLFEGSLDEFHRLMKVVPSWAEGCPIDVSGWTGERYKK